MSETLYLAHHGVKGQKWGVRRFQNEDGSLTDKGVKRYSTKAARLYYKAERNKIKQDKANTFYEYKKAGKKARKASAKSDRVSAGLSKQAVDKGRLKVASSRNLKFKAASVASAAATGVGIAAVAASGAAAAPLAAIGIAAVGGMATGKAIGRTIYYGREKYNYKRSTNGE